MLEESQAWNDIADHVDAYLTRIESSDLPIPIEGFLPSEHGPARNLVIVELAKIEMERLSALGIRPCVDEYLNRFPELAECTGGVPLDLILEEIRLRRIDESCCSRDYAERFPHHAAAIERFFGLPSNSTSTIARSSSNIHQIFRVGETYGDFQILKLLGAGAFAKVFLARQTTMHRMVALKVSADSGDEAKTLAQLDHPNVIRVYDVRQLHEQHLRLLSMQYVPGGTLSDVLRLASQKGPKGLTGSLILSAIDESLLSAGLPAPEESPRRSQLLTATWEQAVCEIGIQLANALEYAHRNRVLHRDVKPANVLLTAEGLCKLADFNISFSESIVGTNPSSYFGGSLIYMSPEQLRAASLGSEIHPGELDARSDVFSLACVLWELLTIERPWPRDALKMDWGATLDELARRRLNERPSVNAEFPLSESARRITDCLSLALIANRELRTPSAAVLAGQLRLCLSPKAWKLLNPLANHWTRLACSHPTLVALGIVFVPNGLAGAFNYHYNHAWLTARHPNGHDALVQVSVVLNSLFFGLGGVFFVFVVWPVTSEISRRMKVDRKLDSTYIQRAILLGHTASVFGLALWLVAGFVFPILLSTYLPAFDSLDAIHFFLSLAVCGAIAVAYPFLGLSSVTIQVWLGLLLGSELRDTRFRERGFALMKWCDRYLLTATAVPLAGLAMLLTQSSPVRQTLAILVAASAIGLFLAFRVHRRIQQSIETLTNVLAPISIHTNQN